MRAGLSVVTPPASEPVSLADAKAWLRVETTADDTLISALISAARDYIEAKTGVAYLTQTLDQVMDCFPYSSKPIDLLRGPVSSITSVSYIDGSGVTQVWGSSNYRINGATRPPRISPVLSQIWPTSMLQGVGAVAIRFVAGYANAGLVPAKWVMLLKFVLGHWYENRSPVEVGTIASKVPEGTDELIELLSPPLFA